METVKFCEFSMKNDVVEKWGEIVICLCIFSFVQLV